MGTTQYVFSNGLLHYEDGPWSGTNDMVIYSYDSSRRRSQLVARQPTGNPLTNSYSWDSGGRLSTVASPAGTHTYTPNELNQAAGSYDSNGNRTSGADSYTYDVENQLIGIEVASRWKLEFVYDGRQRLRVIKDYEYSGGGYSLKGEVRLMYDGMNVIQERNGSGHPTVSYTRGLDLSGTLDGAGGIGGLLTRSSHATSSPYQQNSHAFYHADGNGNVTYLRRSDGASYAAYKYDPFGRTLSSAGGLASANRMRFSSKPWIQSSSGTDGMYYYGYRFYDPLTQRWLNRDPIEENGGVNLFSFVRNDPHNRSDLLGLAYGNPVSGPNGPVGPSSPWGSGGVFNGPDGNTGSVGGGVGAYGVFGGEIAVSFVQCCINNDKYIFTVVTACGGLGVSVGIGGSKPKIEMPGGVKDSPGGSFSAGGDCPQDRYYVKAAVTAGVFEFGRDFVDEGDSVESANGVSVPPSYGGRYVVCSDTVVSVKKTGCCPKPTTPKVR